MPLTKSKIRTIRQLQNYLQPLNVLCMHKVWLYLKANTSSQHKKDFQWTSTLMCVPGVVHIYRATRYIKMDKTSWTNKIFLFVQYVDFNFIV